MLRNQRPDELFTPAAQLVHSFCGHSGKVGGVGIDILASHQIGRRASVWAATGARARRRWRSGGRGDVDRAWFAR